MTNWYFSFKYTRARGCLECKARTCLAKCEKINGLAVSRTGHFARRDATTRGRAVAIRSSRRINLSDIAVLPTGKRGGNEFPVDIYLDRTSLLPYSSRCKVRPILVSFLVEIHRQDVCAREGAANFLSNLTKHFSSVFHLSLPCLLLVSSCFGPHRLSSFRPFSMEKKNVLEKCRTYRGLFSFPAALPAHFEGSFRISNSPSLVKTARVPVGGANSSDDFSR